MKQSMTLLAALVIVASTLAAGPAHAGYAPGSEVSLAITCPSQPASDPMFSFILTNHGSAPVEVEDTWVPISIMVHLTIKDANGGVVQPGTYVEAPRGPRASRFLQPGQSLTLMDIMQPQPTVIPLHLFGYKLASGTYQLSAKATDSPDEPASNVCSVTIN